MSKRDLVIIGGGPGGIDEKLAPLGEAGAIQK